MPERIVLGELKRLLGERAQLIDVLGPREYANEHLPGAINIPLRRLASETTAQLDHHKPIAVYCHDALTSGARLDTRSAQAPAAASHVRQRTSATDSRIGNIRDCPPDVRLRCPAPAKCTQVAGLAMIPA
jgi:rhodanese-related sulfurtransferase